MIGSTPLSAPDAVPAGTAQLAGPGSVTPERLRRDLDRLLGAAPDERPALVVRTSGSTGTPKATVLSAGALRASAAATAEATSSAGARWLLCLPVHYVAGAQVIARSVLAGTAPVSTASLDPGVSFTARGFLDAAHRLGCGPWMTSVVPTQLHELVGALDETAGSVGAERGAASGTGRVPADELLEALRGFSAILVGGAPASAALLSRCRELGLPVVTTYGSAETAGGCVYDARALPGVRVRIEPEAEAPGRGRIWLGGPSIAEGYLGDPARTAEHFRRDAEGTRWYLTEDLGALGPEGKLTVLGRADDVLITGGVKVSARAVEQALEADPRVREALVVGLPDPRWGTRIEALITRSHTGGSAEGAEDLAGSLREAVREALGPAAAPRRIAVRERLPLTSTGKPDRRAAADQLTRDPAAPRR